MSRLLVSAILIILLQTRASSTQSSRCEKNVDISDGMRQGDTILKDGVAYSKGHYFKDIDGSLRGCICEVKHCIRKCCAENEILNLTTRHCVQSEEAKLLPLLQNIIDVPDNEICEDIKIKVNLGKEFEIVEGVLVWDDITFSPEEFCISFQPNETIAIACIVDEQGVSWTKSLGMIISMPFLFLTFLVYLILPDKNIHRVALMCYVLSLLLGYICLVRVQLNVDDIIPQPQCSIVGYSIIFFFLTSFFWMNVMCIDMWLTFSGNRGMTGKRGAGRRRLVYYSLYAIGMPLLHICVVVLLNTYGDERALYHPQLGKAKCFLEDGFPLLFYFYGPMGLLIGINLVLFILTTVKIQKVKRETKMLKHTDSKRHSYEDDKQKFQLYVKLMFAMGINWTMEVISWACNWKLSEIPDAVWYLTDLCNALYGVFIFVMFVAKKKIWHALKRRYYIFIGKPLLAQAVMSSQTNRTSTTDTNASSDHHRMQSLRSNSVRGGEGRPLNGH